MKEVIIISIYKNPNLLNEELNFIKNYFNFDENSPRNFNIKSLTNNINTLVRIRQKKQGIYGIDLEEIFKKDKEENEQKVKDQITSLVENNIPLEKCPEHIQNNQLYRTTYMLEKIKQRNRK